MEQLSAALRHRLTGVDMLLLDVDGTLTDGGMWYDDAGQAHKRFFVQDGLGIVLAREAGIAVGLVTARTSRVVEQYARELGITLVLQGMHFKPDALPVIARKTRVMAARIAYMGDDLNDLPLFEQVGFTFAPADAAEAVRKRADHVTAAPGGRGAVREACELLLVARKIDLIDHTREVTRRLAGKS